MVSKCKFLSTFFQQYLTFYIVLAVAFVRELANRLASPTPVIVASVNPGFCKSKLTREIEAKFPGSLLVPLLKAAIARPTETGARVLVRSLTDSDERKMHGHFVTSCEVAEESDLLLGYDGTQFSQKLWVSSSDH